MTWESVAARRMARHGLSGDDAAGPYGDPVAAVAAMCGAHAQVLAAGEASVALRVRGGTRTGVRRAVGEDRTLIKTFGPRGTVHLLPTEDLPMWTGALSALPAHRSALPPDRRLTPAQSEELVAALDVILREDAYTPDEVTERLVEAAGPWAGDLVMPAFQGWWPRWRQAVGLAAHRGVLCFGPNRGRQVTYTHPARWLPGFTPAEPEPAAASLLLRYLHAYGPAAPAHYARWLSVPPPAVAPLFERLAASGEIEPVRLAGEDAFVAAGDAVAKEEPVRGVRLLPYFDAFAVGCYPRELLFPGRAWDRALARGQAGNFPVLLVDGVVAGVWHQRLSGRKVQVTAEPLEPLTKGYQRQLEAEVERLGEILGAVPSLTVGTVTVGPHA